MYSTPALTECLVPQVFHRHGLETAQGTIMYIFRNGCLMCGQKSPIAKRKSEAAFTRLDKLGLGVDGEGVVDVQESLQRADLFASVTRPLPPIELYADALLESSVGLNTSFKKYWVVLRLWATRKTTTTFRLCLDSWTISGMPSPIIRSVAIPNRFYGQLISATGPDGAATGHIRSESETYCESFKRLHVNVPDGSTG